MAVDKQINKAQQALQSGHFDEVEKICKKILRKSPRHIDALNLLSISQMETGRITDAIKSIETALLVQPANAMLLNNLAYAYQGTGDLIKAEQALQRAVKADKKNAGAFYNLAVLQSQTGQIDLAINNYKQVLALQPAHVETHFNIANLYADSNQPELAETHYRQVTQIQPSMVEAWYNLAQLYQQQAETKQAIETFSHVTQLDPSIADAWYCLGNLYQTQDVQQSVTAFEKAVSINATLLDAWNGILKTYIVNQQYEQALIFVRHAQQDSKISRHLNQYFPYLLNSTTVNQYSQHLADLITDVYQIKNVDHQLLSSPSVCLLRLQAELEFFFNTETAINLDQCKLLSANSLFCNTVSSTIIVDADFERQLTAIRRLFLLKAEALLSDPVEFLKLANALALYCFNNEYIFTSDQSEQDTLHALVNSLSPASPDIHLLITAMYTPLYKLELASSIAETASESCQQVITQQIIEPQLENKLKADLKTLTPISDDVSLAVQQQYEQSPYPRWTSININQPVMLNAILENLFPFYPFPDFLNKPVHTLVAGCGTGKHLISVATRYRYSKLLTIDLSCASLAYAKRKVDEFKLTNIDFLQADILKLDALEQRFQVIESAGVLHHLQDPVAGWKILCDLLEPGGLMRIGLYSRIARENISAARDFVQLHNFNADAEGIRQARQAILKLENNNTVKPVTTMYDFYTSSACRDLIFHVQEHCYTLPEIGQILKDLKLEFIGFEHPDEIVAARYLQNYPEDRSMTNLENWHPFEQDNPDTFLGMYQFWCQKK